MVPIRLSDLLAIPTFQREMRREVTTRRVYGVNTTDYFEGDSEGLADDEEPLVRLFGEVRSVGQMTKGKDLAASQRQDMTHAQVTEKGSEEDEIRRGQRNDPAKWKTRPLLTRSPYIRDVEVCSLDGGFYVAMVPNDDGSQMNLISTSLAKAVEGRGVTVDWDYEFSMRTANGQVEDLKGLVPALPVFIRGVRFEIAALVVGDSAPFALLWGSPANTGANSKTFRHPNTREMLVRMENPEGYAVYYTGIEGTDPRDLMIDESGKATKAWSEKDKDEQAKVRFEGHF
ncbi:hypothetical protein HDU67_003533 [Dinochytrium kinnereticum]|nr:hypothetical protein HDU67_003533 [Dinochytrium kinnereticum]